MATLSQTLWQQPVADMWRKSTRAGQAWSDTTPAYPSVFQELCEPQRMSLHSEGPHRLSFVSSFLNPSIPKGIRITAWQRVPQNYLLSCTFPACHLIGIESPPTLALWECVVTCSSVASSMPPRILQSSVMSSSQLCFSQPQGGQVNQLGFVQKSFHISEYPCRFSLHFL